MSVKPWEKAKVHESDFKKAEKQIQILEGRLYAGNLRGKDYDRNLQALNRAKSRALSARLKMDNDYRERNKVDSSDRRRAKADAYLDELASKSKSKKPTRIGRAEFKRKYGLNQSDYLEFVSAVSHARQYGAWSLKDSADHYDLKQKPKLAARLRLTYRRWKAQNKHQV